MRRHVDRHAVDARGEVGAVVQVEAAQEVLVRLAVAAVLRHDEPGDGLEDLGGPEDRAVLELGGEHGALARRRDVADQCEAPGVDDHLFQAVDRGNAAGHAGPRQDQPGQPEREPGRCAARDQGWSPSREV